MRDEDLEQLIGRYRPADPPSNLRERIVAAAALAPRVRLGTVDWVFAATAAALTLAAVATRTSQGIIESAEEAERQLVVRDTAEMLGGGGEAIRLAELIVPPLPRPATDEFMEGQ